jgi:capsular exopolysaccharide synthesis family protein
MSRIDEALRRAAERQHSDEKDAVAAASTHALAGQEIETLADEPFPVEITEHRRLRAPAPAADEPPPRQSSTRNSNRTTSEPAENEETTTNGRGRLFERIDSRLAEKVVADANMSPLSREQYRRLAAVLHDAQANNGLKVVMIASAVPGEGKTLTAANLALTLSESYRQRVLLIDADLRKPTMHQIFQLNAATGLIEGLEADSEVKLVLRQVSPQLSILPAGRPTNDPMAGLTSERMHHLLIEAKETFDWVIIDTPPLMLLPDAHLLSSMVDGAVLIVRANSTPHEHVKRAADIIGRQRIAGVVLNQAESMVQPGYGAQYYHGYYLPQKETTDKS